MRDKTMGRKTGLMLRFHKDKQDGIQHNTTSQPSSYYIYAILFSNRHIYTYTVYIFSHEKDILWTAWLYCKHTADVWQRKCIYIAMCINKICGMIQPNLWFCLKQILTSNTVCALYSFHWYFNYQTHMYVEDHHYMYLLITDFCYSLYHPRQC